MGVQTKRPQAVSLQQAMAAAPTLARLSERVALTQRMFAVILPLLPAGLRGNVHAGPLEDGVWCLLVAHTATAAKLRQLAPALEAALAQAGQPVGQLRVKVHRQAHSNP